MVRPTDQEMTVIEKIGFFYTHRSQERGMHATPQRATQGSTRVRQEAKGGEESVVDRKEWARWGEQT